MHHAPTNDNPLVRIRPLSLTWKAMGLRVGLFLLLAYALGACDSTGPPDADLVGPGEVDTTTPSPLPDTVGGDTTAPSPGSDSIIPPPDSTVPPPDSMAPPPDSTTGPIAPPGPVSHVGLPFGPSEVPARLFAEFSATAYLATAPDKLIRDLEAARGKSARLFISFTGSDVFNRDENGFSLAKWTQRMDRFLGVDLTPYIADGTIVGHLILDEPQDKSNWNGHRVSQADIEAMAKHSKEVWPAMPTVIRVFPDYLQGYQYPHLDALRIQYLHRFGSIEDFIATHIQGAKALGLKIIGGLNLLSGGSGASGIPGARHGMYAMSADEIRSWGGRFLSEPYLCGFLMWEYDSTYFSRPDIQGAMSELAQKARSLPNQTCD